jgi:hypothetical protein
MSSPLVLSDFLDFVFSSVEDDVKNPKARSFSSFLAIFSSRVDKSFDFEGWCDDDDDDDDDDEDEDEDEDDCPLVRFVIMFA